MNLPAHSLRYRDGDVIAGKYRLTQPLGEGGMGEVWEGVNMVLDAPVAIKLVKADLTDDVLRQRLLREARTAAGLDHPAIIRVFDVGETADGKPYVVMERLHGASLRDLVDQPERRDVVEVAQALLPILDALSLAHDRGLVHRDVKPDNIFLSQSGDRLQPKLLDFGVVKAQAYQRFLTHTGTVVGSPPYMSPEQARGDEDIDSLADLWAVAVILFEAATGRMPFEAPNYNALLRRIVEDEVPPVVSDNPVVASLAPIIDRGLHKDREQRWQSAEELGRALAGWLLKLGVGEDLCGQRLTGRWVAAGRKSIAERRRASLVDLSAARVSPLPLTPATSESTPSSTFDAPTPSTPRGSTARAKSWFLLAGLFLAGLVVGVGGLLLGLSGDAESDAPESTSVGSPVAQSEPLAKQASAATPPAEPVRKAEEAAAAPVVSALASAAPQSAARSRKSSPPRAGSPTPRAPAQKKTSTPDLGLKDPY